MASAGLTAEGKGRAGQAGGQGQERWVGAARQGAVRPSLHTSPGQPLGQRCLWLMGAFGPAAEQPPCLPSETPSPPPTHPRAPRRWRGRRA